MIWFYICICDLELGNTQYIYLKKSTVYINLKNPTTDTEENIYPWKATNIEI